MWNAHLTCSPASADALAMAWSSPSMASLRLASDWMLATTLCRSRCSTAALCWTCKKIQGFVNIDHYKTYFLKLPLHFVCFVYTLVQKKSPCLNFPP